MEETEKPKKNSAAQILSSVAVILFAIIAIGWYIFNREEGFKNNSANTEAAATTTNGLSEQLPSGVSVQVERVEADDIGPAPGINRQVVFPAGYPESSRPAFLSKLADIKSKISASPRSPELWIELGLMFDVVEDYEGARQMWEYATKLAPQNSIAFNNLGFLYGYHLRDYGKAEQNFRTAIANTPKDLYYYQQTFEFYRDVLKDEVKARALAAEGERVTGNKEFFKQLLETL